MPRRCLTDKNLPIDMTEWLRKYKARTAVSGQELVTAFNKAPSIVEKALTPDAIQRFQTNVVSQLAMKKREVNLKAVGDAGIKAAMSAKGAAAYVAGTGHSADKAAKNFTPIAQAIDAALATLPPRTADGIANVTTRVIPIVKAAIDASKARVGA